MSCIKTINHRMFVVKLIDQFSVFTKLFCDIILCVHVLSEISLLRFYCQGKITVKHLVVSEVAAEGVKSLWRQRPCPFVYSYDKISGIDMCIDARYVGVAVYILA